MPSNKLHKISLKALKTFSLDSSIHGLRYIVQPSRHRAEKIFWFLSALISLIFTSVLIYRLILHSQKNPTVIYTDKNTVNIKDITFPAVTACLGLVYRTNCDKVIDYDLIQEWLLKNKKRITKLTPNQLKFMQILSLASHDHFMSENFPQLKIPTNDFMKQLQVFLNMIPPNSTSKGKTTAYLMESLWLNKYLLNTVQVLSDSGSCYTFNMPPVEDIYKPESVFYNFSFNRVHKFGQTGFFEIFDAVHINTSYPQKARARNEGFYLELDDAPMKCLLDNGNESSLNFFEGSILDPTKDGFYVKVHGPYEVPTKKDWKFTLNIMEHIDLSVTPKITRIDESLLDASLDVRNCYLTGERELEFFKVYNKVNCEHECMTQMTLKSCGCVQFFMAKNQTTKICGTSDEKCFQEVEDNFDMIKSVCKCLDPCESLTYEIDLKNRGRYYVKEGFQRNHAMSAKVSIAVDSVFVLSKKKTQTAVEFLSFVGGLLGLFAGFSVMTVAEVIYYFMAYPLIEKKKRNIRKVQPFNDKNETNFVILRKFEISRYIKDALQGSSIHGFNHIGGDFKSWIERILWSILFILFMILASYMVQDVLITYKKASIVINYEGSPTKVEEIPFPAFTIVRDLELTVGDIFNDNITGFDFNPDYYHAVFYQFRFTACIKFGYMYRIPILNFSSNKDFMEVLDYYTFYQHPWFEARNASWNKFVNPPFAKILTSTLKGYTFNLIEQSKMLNEDLISDDFYYSYENGKKPGFPWRTSAGDETGLKLEVDLNYAFTDNLYDNCRLRDTIVLHPPNELPTGHEQISITKSSFYNILVAPKVIKADEDLRSLDLSIRKCYFEDERKLKFFKIYTQRNCELECQSHIFTRICNCTPYYQVRNKTANICDFLRSKKCHVYLQNYINYTAYDHLYETDGLCNCLPTCNSIEYSYEIIRTGERIDYMIYDQSSIFEMRWKDSEYFAMVRSQQLRLVDLLAYVGGILGLFAGISVLSIFEILYFLTLRLATDLMRAFRL